MSIRLVPKSVTLNDLERRYFTKFDKPAFQLLTASSSIDLIDQKSASITHRTVKFVCVTKFTHSRVDTTTQIYWTRLTLLTYNLPSKFNFNTIYHNVFCLLPVVVWTALCCAL